MQDVLVLIMLVLALMIGVLVVGWAIVDGIAHGTRSDDDGPDDNEDNEEAPLNPDEESEEDPS